MITLKLKIKNRINVTTDCENYSYLFRKLYSNFELSEDKNFRDELREKFNIDSWIFQSCKTEVAVKLEQQETSNKKKIALLTNLETELSKSIESKRHKYRVFKKIALLKSSLNDKIIFGGKSILRKISFLSNDREKNKKEINAWTAQYNRNRLLPICIIGETPQKGNRKFDFDFENKKMVFKPQRGIKIPIEFHCGKGQHKQLIQLQQMIGTMPISVRLNNDYVWITFDEKKLNGFAFNEIEYFKELKTIPKSNKQSRKDCYKKWIHEQESRMLVGKIKDGFISFDLNPEYIGFSVLEKMGESDFKVLYKEAVSLTSLNTKMGLSSTDIIQIKQNNKRVHELRQVWKYIFEIAKHYQVANCSMEDLEFKEKSINGNAPEANRKTKNIWHRTLTLNAIKKHCNIIGIKLIP